MVSAPPSQRYAHEVGSQRKKRMMEQLSPHGVDCLTGLVPIGCWRPGNSERRKRAMALKCNGRLALAVHENRPCGSLRGCRVLFISYTNRRKRRDDGGRRSLDGRRPAAPRNPPRQKVAVAGSGPMRPLGESSASIFLMSSPSSLKSNTPMFSFNRSSRTVFGITIRPLSRCQRMTTCAGVFRCLAAISTSAPR